MSNIAVNLDIETHDVQCSRAATTRSSSRLCDEIHGKLNDNCYGNSHNVLGIVVHCWSILLGRFIWWIMLLGYIILYLQITILGMKLSVRTLRSVVNRKACAT